MTLPFVVEMYLMQAPGMAREEVVRVVDAAADRAQAKHPDFERFLPGVEFLSRVVFASHTAIPIDDYLEALYCTVKHGDFTKDWRSQLRAKKAAQ